jgi:hypothetical protein
MLKNTRSKFKIRFRLPYFVIFFIIHHCLKINSFILIPRSAYTFIWVQKVVPLNWLYYNILYSWAWNVVIFLQCSFSFRSRWGQSRSNPLDVSDCFLSMVNLQPLVENAVKHRLPIFTVIAFTLQYVKFV